MTNERYENGKKIRREILGDKFMRDAEDRSTKFNEPFQELIVEYVWGALWGRSGLDHRTRLLINLGILTAMGRNEQTKNYLRAAPKLGVTRDEIREVLMQTAIYCGVPAAMEGFRVSQEVFDEQDKS